MSMQGGQTERPQYWVWVKEQWRVLDTHQIPDPFITTSVRPCGWRNALAVLFGRYEIEVRVDGSPQTIESVLELDPDYLGAPGSERNKRWRESLERALSAFAEGESNDH